MCAPKRLRYSNRPNYWATVPIESPTMTNNAISSVTGPASAILSTALIFLTVSPAVADVDLYSCSSKIFGTAVQQAANFSDSYGTITAELATGPNGSMTSTLATAATSITMTSAMTVTGGVDGEATAAALYSFADAVMLTVDWNWGTTNLTGNWNVKTGATVAHSLSFSNGVFTSTGGSFGQSASGTTTFLLAAGSYEFNSLYRANTMPTQSLVRFTWGAVPAPGAVAAFGLIGLRGRRRRCN